MQTHFGRLLALLGHSGQVAEQLELACGRRPTVVVAIDVQMLGLDASIHAKDGTHTSRAALKRRTARVH